MVAIDADRREIDHALRLARCDVRREGREHRIARASRRSRDQQNIRIFDPRMEVAVVGIEHQRIKPARA